MRFRILSYFFQVIWFDKIINININDIKKTYYRYLNPSNYQYKYRKILVDFFYLIVVTYAYNINHYFYINQHGKDKQHLLHNGQALFQEINKYVTNNYLVSSLDIKINVQYHKLMLCGEIDFIEQYPESETIVEIKCVKEISIKYYLQLVLYNFCHYQTQPDKLFCNKFKILNLLTGLEYNLVIKISPTNMFDLLIMLAEIGNLCFDKMNLVYDLEATNLITSKGPFNHRPTIPRGIVTKRGFKYYAEVYPEIIEISIKDYDTEMVLLNTLVKPNMSINKEVEKLTGITPAMLEKQPCINTIRNLLENKMKRFINCKMMAHNGTRFDNKIMLYDKLIGQQVSFLDTLSIIPIHLPVNMKLKKKNLGCIYHQLFGKTFNAHRAMADVNALIRIMKHLQVKF